MPLREAVGSNMFRRCFDNPRYSRPCVGAGTYDVRKHPKFVVSDLCIRARKFLEQRGYVGHRPDQWSTYEQYSEPDEHMVNVASSPETSSQVSNVSLSNIILSQPSDPSESDGEAAVEDGDSTVVQNNPWSPAASSVAIDPDNAFFEEFDISSSQADQLLEDAEMVSVSDMHSSQTSDLLTPVGNRRTTGIRAPTLAYLWGFATQPLRLRDEFRRLREDDSFVLHLCGCGVCEHDVTDLRGRRHGCCEPSHLRLGTREENLEHFYFHKVLTQGRPQDYAMCVQLRFNARPEEGTF